MLSSAHMYDLIIIGGGPAGVAAGVYAARKKLKTVLIAEEIGGQSVVSEGIENWIGTAKVSGADLAKNFKTHLETIKGDSVELAIGERVEKLEKSADGFTATTKKGSAYSAKAVLIASGAGRRKLDVPGAAQFENRGVTYCASCDGPLFDGQDVAVIGGGNAALETVLQLLASCDGPLFGGMDVAVIGGGNAGFETAAQLLAYANSVTLLHRHKEFKADPVTVEKVSADQKMRVITHAEPTEVLGEGNFVTGLKYKDKDSGEEKELKVSGIFVEAGVIPNTGFAEGLVELDPIKRVKADPKNQRTTVEGIWAAGDCTDELYHQNNIAAGDGVKALEDIYLWIKMH